MSAGFTPGPWDAGSRVVEVAGSDFTPIDGAEYTVAFVPVAARANARLIAAAPELYAELEKCVDHSCTCDECNRLRAVLAKARGES